MNPFNPEAGAAPYPVDPAVVRIAERSAAVIWRAFPYFNWRFNLRGRAFGRSDAGYLTTLAGLPPPTQQAQVLWLARLLSARGMPSLLLEVQLELLGRVGGRDAWVGAASMRELARQLRVSRQLVMPDEHLRACERHFAARTVSCHPRLRSIGILIAAEVADLRLGYVERNDATLAWLLSHGPADPSWPLACEETRALAEAVRAPPP